MEEVNTTKNYLLALMKSYSKEWHHSGWTYGLEEVLSGSDKDYNATWPDWRKKQHQDELTEIQRISNLCNGWWVWSIEGSDPRFVTLEEWSKLETHS